MLPDNDSRQSFDGGVVVYDNLGNATGSADEHYTDKLYYPLRMQFLLMILCRQGHLHFRFNLADYDIKAGDVIVVIPGTICEEMSYSPDVEMAAMMIDSDMYGALPANIGENVAMKDLTLSKPIIIACSEPQTDYLVTSFQQIRFCLQNDCFQRKDALLRGHLQSLSAALIDIFRQRQQHDTPQTLTRGQQIYAQFLRDVSKHFAQHRDTAFYASLQFITPKYLGHVVLEQCGRRPSEIIREHVLLEAKALLRTGQYTAQQVSDRLNFPNQSFFGKYFKEYVGCSPGQFIKK